MFFESLAVSSLPNPLQVRPVANHVTKSSQLGLASACWAISSRTSPMGVAGRQSQVSPARRESRTIQGMSNGRDSCKAESGKWKAKS